MADTELREIALVSVARIVAHLENADTATVCDALRSDSKAVADAVAKVGPVLDGLAVEDKPRTPKTSPK